MNKYLVASGNWSDPSIWSATSGGAGGAGVPTASDYVYLDKNYTLTLDVDASCGGLTHTNGTLSLSSYSLSIAEDTSGYGGGLVSSGTAVRTLNLNSGTLSVGTTGIPGTDYTNVWVNLSGTNLTVNAGTSLVILNVVGTDLLGSFQTLSKSFNDVRINMGDSVNGGQTLNITGSPTFRLLDIRSANSAAHTVNFEGSGSEVTVDKLVMIGSSSSSKLTMTASSSGAFINFTANATCYGQYISMDDTKISPSVDSTYPTPLYIGSSSSSVLWLTQDPPKISTLVDPLTTDPASNPNWTVTGTVTKVTTGHDGGGYDFSDGEIVSADTYDMTDSELIIELPSFERSVNFNYDLGTYSSVVFLNDFPTLYGQMDTPTDSSSQVNIDPPSLVKIKVTPDKKLQVLSSSDGSSWTNRGINYQLTDDEYVMLKSVRQDFAYGVIGSINPSLISAPAVSTGAVTNLANTTVTLAGNVTSDGGATVTERGIVYATTANPTTANSKKTVTGTTGAYTGNVTGLTAGTTYHYRAYAINSIGTSYGADQTFTTDTTPTVTTTSSSSLTDVSATLTGNITATGGKNPTERGFQYGTTSGSYPQTVKEIGSYGTGSFSLSATSLTQTTTYYYRAYAKNAYGTVYGTEKSFTTLKTKPVANFTTDVTSGDYKLLVHFTDTSTETPTSWSWDFGDGGTSTTQNPQHTYQSAGTFTVKLTATNAGGSNTVTKTNLITVNTVAPTVSTGTTSSVTQTGATLAGSITDFGGTNATERGFNYGTTSGSLTNNTSETGSFAAGSFSLPISALTSNTTYYYQAYAKNSAGTATGTTENFTTVKKDATASTGTAGSLTLTGATISGNTISNPDGQTITERGVAYATTQNPTIANSKVTGTGSPFNVTLSGLTANTTYYARAYVTFAGTTNYGSQISFKTQGKPTVALNTPSNNGSTPDTKSKLEFTGTDPDSDQLTYEIQINTTNSFTSPLIDALSATDSGFTDQTVSKTDPFYSGDKVRYTLQTDLTRGSSYYWRVRAKDPSGSNSWGNWSSTYKFTVAAVTPTVQLTGFSDVQDTSLSVNGSITDTGGAAVTEQGVVWGLTVNPTVTDNKVTAGTTSPFTAAVTGLSASTTYHFRAYAINSAGTAYSSDVTQMTLQPLAPPTVTTTDASNISDITAKVGGEVTLDGQRTVTERGVVFGTSANPTTADRKFTDTVGGLGVFNGTITGLDASTLYHYRAYAINDQGTGYGADKTFTTLAPFTPDQGDGHWTFSVSGSNAIVSRDQPTDVSSSCNLPLEDLVLLENGQQYTLAVGDITSDNGDPKLVLQWYDGATQHEQVISANSQYTFTYDTTFIHWSLRLFVTQGTAVADNITATFNNMYLAKESVFSSFVDFIPRGVTEVKIVNNQIIDSRRQDVIDSIFQKLKGFSYYPFEIDTEGLGWFQIGDGFDITDEDNNTINVIAFDSKLTLDGGMTENLKADEPTNTTTDYSKAGSITKLISNTTLQVDKQNETITALVSDVYDDNGYIDNKFSSVEQSIDAITQTVQGAGGVNLIRNSAMYAYNNLGYPDSWTTINDSGNNAPIIQASPESVSAGGISGNSFTLTGQKVTQTVSVKKDADFIAQDDKIYYTFNVKIKKNLVGVAHIKLSNRNETHEIDLATGDSYFWQDFTIEALLPQDDHYDIELYSDSDAQAQFTDAMLSVGQSPQTWTQAPGEVGSTNFSITQDGATFRQAQFKYNYTQIDALGFYVIQKVLGSSQTIFGFTGDTTNVSKLEAANQISMEALRVVPMTIDGEAGWAFTVNGGNS